MMPTPLRRNVPLSLTLPDANCAEVLAGVAAQWGFPILLMDRAAVFAARTKASTPEELARLEPVFRRLEERADFHWEHILFADVLRDVAARFALSGHWYGGRLTLTATDNPRTGRPPFGVAAYDDGLVRVYPRCITHTATRSRWFIQELAEADPLQLPASMMLSLTCEFPGEDADRLAGIRNCVASDDCGRRLEARGVPDEWEFQSLADLGAYPDEWQGRSMFPSPTPEAQTLVSLEGDLIHFEDYFPVRIEFQLPLRETVREAGPIAVEITHFEAGARQAGEAGSPGLNHRSGGPKVEARIKKPKGTYLSSLGEYSHISPTLVGAEGTHYQNEPTGSGICGRDDLEVEIEAEFVPANDPPARLIFDLVLKGRPAKLVTFRLHDIPLP